MSVIAIWVNRHRPNKLSAFLTQGACQAWDIDIAQLQMKSALTELLKKPKVPQEWGKPYSLWVHDDHVSPLELVVNPEVFPKVSAGHAICITIQAKPNSTPKRVYFRVSSVERGPFKQTSFQVLNSLLDWRLLAFATWERSKKV